MDFMVLAATTITNTGPSIVSGSIGVAPGTAITGFPPGACFDRNYADGEALAAQVSLRELYRELLALKPTKILTGEDLGGMVLEPGVYLFHSSAQLTGNLVLNAKGAADAAFVFLIGSTLVAANDSTIDLVNGTQAKNISWCVGSSATIGTNSEFAGRIIAQISITLMTGAKLIGAAWAMAGAVMMDNNLVASRR